MAFSLFLSSLKTPTISLILLSTLLFFLFLTPSPNYPSTNPLIPHRSLLNTTTTTTTTTTSLSCSSILQTPPHNRCSFSLLHCTGDSNSLINYFSLHFCLFHQNPFASVPFLFLTILFQFYVLVKTAQDQFSVVVTKLVTHLNLSPSIGAVTLLALGNGAPDVFASVAAVRGGHPRTGFGAILSAGTFVSALVVGFVAIYAAPFSVDPVPFVRDVLFYLTAALFLFYVYLSAEIFLWQAIGFVGFYLFFVGFVFWMDLGMDGGKRKGGVEVGGGLVGDVEVRKDLIALDYENEELLGKVEEGKPGFHFRQVVRQVCFGLQFCNSDILHCL
ncbi:cation/calcium exchanger 5-like [Camellia sinensis]|uniref:cation/calcium exchanger 5-like n=1 Tax=Camellia sinensis TaxID=4442 RepID=UPI001036BB3C|nr:cation/calcium exchanger 5-like [Camellia sinensis]